MFSCPVCEACSIVDDPDHYFQDHNLYIYCQCGFMLISVDNKNTFINISLYSDERHEIHVKINNNGDIIEFKSFNIKKESWTFVGGIDYEYIHEQYLIVLNSKLNTFLLNNILLT